MADDTTPEDIRKLHATAPETGEERARYLMQLTLERAKDPNDHEWSLSLFPHLTVASTTPTTMTFKFTPQPIHLNGLGNMHGGCIATLFDFCTSCALSLVSKPGFWNYLGVSRSINTTYLRPVPVYTEVLVECELVSVGKRLAQIRGTLRRAGGRGEIFATCEHGKFNTDPEPGKL
ncbi:hypothetical protein OQA88_2807 [Cercophora sp. LCS_1]